MRVSSHPLTLERVCLPSTGNGIYMGPWKIDFIVQRILSNYDSTFYADSVSGHSPESICLSDHFCDKTVPWNFFPPIDFPNTHVFKAIYQTPIYTTNHIYFLIFSLISLKSNFASIIFVIIILNVVWPNITQRVWH